MLLIFDEAQTGLCRTGDCTASSATASSRTSSRCPRRSAPGLPLAAVVTSAEIEERAHERGYLFYTTHVSDPLVAAVGNTVLDVLDATAWARASRRRASCCTPGCASCQDRHAVIGDVRGRGLMQGLEIVLDRETKESSPELGAAVTARCLELGLHMNIVQLREMGGTFRIAPALTTHRRAAPARARDPRPGDRRTSHRGSSDGLAELRLTYAAASLAPLLGGRRRQREGQRGAVAAGPERVVGSDVLVEPDRRAPVGDRRGPRRRRDRHPQR